MCIMLIVFKSPQKWAYQERIGSFLMEKPVLVADMVDQVKRRTAPMNFQSKSGTGYPCSIKIRINKDLKDTIDMVQRAEARKIILFYS